MIRPQRWEFYCRVTAGKSFHQVAWEEKKSEEHELVTRDLAVLFASIFPWKKSELTRSLSYAGVIDLLGISKRTLERQGMEIPWDKPDRIAPLGSHLKSNLRRSRALKLRGKN